MRFALAAAFVIASSFVPACSCNDGRNGGGNGPDALSDAMQIDGAVTGPMDVTCEMLPAPSSGTCDTTAGGASLLGASEGPQPMELPVTPSSTKNESE